MNNAESLWRMEVVGNFNRLRERAAQFLSLQFDDSEQRCSFLGSSFVEGNSEMPRASLHPKLLIFIPGLPVIPVIVPDPLFGETSFRISLIFRDFLSKDRCRLLVCIIASIHEHPRVSFRNFNSLIDTVIATICHLLFSVRAIRVKMCFSFLIFKNF